MLAPYASGRSTPYLENLQSWFPSCQWMEAMWSKRRTVHGLIEAQRWWLPRLLAATSQPSLPSRI